jgi:hypothetical protein
MRPIKKKKKKGKKRATKKPTMRGWVEIQNSLSVSE